MDKKNTIVREVRIFEFYKKFIWPVQRLFVQKLLAKRCSKCFLPETYVQLIDGVCLHCKKGEEIIPRDKAVLMSMQEDFDQMIKKEIKKEKPAYHAVLLFSGGKDSSYLLHHMQHHYPGMRILALTIDNTFMSPVAMENISAIVEKTGVDHMVIRPKARMMEKMFGHAFTHLNEKGCSGTVDQFDGDFFCDVARNMAAKMDIPYIICGLSRDQVENIFHLDTFKTPLSDEAKKREVVADIILEDLFTEDEMEYWWDGSRWPEEKLPQMLFPFYFWDLEEEYIKSEVLRLGLMPRGDESPMVTNNSLIPLMGLVDIIQFGYSSFEPEFARNVRIGKAERKEWLYTFETLEYAAKTGRLLGKSIDEALARLSLTRQDLGIKGG